MCQLLVQVLEVDVSMTPKTYCFSLNENIKTYSGVSEMCQRMKVLGTKVDNLNLFPRIHEVTSTSCPLISTYIHVFHHTKQHNTHTHTHTSVKTITYQERKRKGADLQN